jgi:hypothetical protein
MDFYYEPEGFRIRLRALDMMADVVRSENCLHNRSLISTLAQRYTGLVTDALQRGYSEIVTAAVRQCRTLPISLSRSLRLSMYGSFNVFPPAVYLTWAALWQNVRRRLLRGRRGHPKTE